MGQTRGHGQANGLVRAVQWIRSGSQGQKEGEQLGNSHLLQAGELTPVFNPKLCQNWAHYYILNLISYQTETNKDWPASTSQILDS